MVSDQTSFSLSASWSRAFKRFGISRFNLAKFGAVEECPWRGVTPRFYPWWTRGGIRGNKPPSSSARHSASAPRATGPRQQRLGRSRDLTACETALGSGIARRRRVGERRRECSGIRGDARRQRRTTRTSSDTVANPPTHSATLSLAPDSDLHNVSRFSTPPTRHIL